jgi:hypothetical protein
MGRPGARRREGGEPLSPVPERLTAALADRFLSEIRTTASLTHPHILPLFDSGASDGLFYLIPRGSRSSNPSTSCTAGVMDYLE